MSKPEFTPWFSGHIKPARKGVYQLWGGRRDKIGYQLWDGNFWHTWEEKKDQAAKSTWIASSSSQNDEWRGLTSPGE